MAGTPPTRGALVEVRQRKCRFSDILTAVYPSALPYANQLLPTISYLTGSSLLRWLAVLFGSFLDMTESTSLRDKVRKSRQAHVPVIKFRSSYDACTDAKVRCDKQHPHCGRCTRIGCNCNYSVSMRTRKPAIKFAKSLQAGMPLLFPPPGSPNQDTIENSTDVPGTLSMANITHRRANEDLPIKIMPQEAEASNQEMNIDPESGMTSLPSSFSDALVYNAVMKASNADDNVPSSPRADSTAEGVGLAGSSGAGDDVFTLASVYDQSLSFSLSTSPPMDLDYLSHLSLPEWEPQQLVSLADPKVTEKRASNNVMAVDPALQQITGPQDEGHSCLRVAKRVQHSAIIMASKGETPEQNQDISSEALPATATTTDQALLMCSTTAKQLMDILRCRCQSDAYLPLLLTVLISKVLATYSAIAKADDSTPFRFVTSTSVQNEHQLQTQQPQGKHRDAFLPVPLKLGAYEVEEDLEGLLRAQMVLYELSKMECVAQLFAERYCHSSAGHDSLAEDCTVYTALAEFIKNRYARTKAVCELKSPMLTKT